MDEAALENSGEGDLSDMDDFSDDNSEDYSDGGDEEGEDEKGQDDDQAMAGLSDDEDIEDFDKSALPLILTLTSLNPFFNPTPIRSPLYPTHSLSVPSYPYPCLPLPSPYLTLPNPYPRPTLPPLLFSLPFPQ